MEALLTQTEQVLLSLMEFPEGDYYIVIEHRNHLSVMSKNKVTLPNVTVYDFTTAQDKAYGTNPMADLGGGNLVCMSGMAMETDKSKWCRLKISNPNR